MEMEIFLKIKNVDPHIKINYPDLLTNQYNIMSKVWAMCAIWLGTSS